MKCLSKHNKHYNTLDYYEGSPIELDITDNSNCCSIHIQSSSNKLVLHIGIVDGKFLCGDILSDCGYCKGTGETQYPPSLGWSPTTCNICKGTGKTSPFFTIPGAIEDFPDECLCTNCKKQAQDMGIW